MRWNWLLLCGVVFSMCSGAAEYRITVDGEAMDSSAPDRLTELGLDDDRAVLQAGRWRLILEEPGEYYFSTDSNKTGRLYRELNGESCLVGIAFNNKKGVEEQDLSDLTPEAMRGLRSVAVSGEPDDEVLALIGNIDPELAFLDVSEPFFGRKGGVWPNCNPAVQFLRTSYGISPNTIDHAALASYTNLLYLDYGTGARETDASIFTNCTKLCYLDLNGADLCNAGALVSLTDLHYLDLSYCKGFDDTDFLRGMKQLRFLMLNQVEAVKDVSFVKDMPLLKVISVNGTGVSNLQPLEKLEMLEQAGASYAPVKKLPRKKMSNLTMLRVMESKLSEKTVAEFSKANPQCRVSRGWNQVFEHSTEGVNRLRVRSGGTCHVDVTKEKTLFESSDPNEIAALMKGIKVDENNSGFHCMCCGEPTLEFYHDNVLIASIGFHHGKSLRWADGEWPGDAGLTKASAEFLVTWLDEHGVSGPREEREYAEKQARESAIAWERWEKAMPECLKDYPSADGPVGRSKDDLVKMNELLEKAFPYVNNRILALLSWYGSGKGPWSGYPSYESDVEKLLMTYSTMEILQSVNEVELSEAQTEGLARFLGGWSFSKQRKKDRQLISEDLKKKLLEHSLKSDDDDKKGRAQNAFGT